MTSTKKAYRKVKIFDGKKYEWKGQLYTHMQSLGKAVSWMEQEGKSVKWQVVELEGSKIRDRKFGFILYCRKK